MIKSCNRREDTFVAAPYSMVETLVISPRIEIYSATACPGQPGRRAGNAEFFKEGTLGL